MSLLEQSRRARRRHLVVTAAVLGGLAVGVGWWLAAPARPRVPSAVDPSAGAGIVAEVLNGTRRARLAWRGTTMLRDAGVDVVYFGTTDTATLRREGLTVTLDDPSGPAADSTTILLRRDADRNRPRADRIARLLGTRRVVTRLDTLRRVDITVYLGLDFRPTAGWIP